MCWLFPYIPISFFFFAEGGGVGGGGGLLKRCNKMHVCVCVCVCVIALKMHFHLHLCVIFIAEEGQYKITCQNASMDTTAKTKLY